MSSGGAGSGGVGLGAFGELLAFGVATGVGAGCAEGLAGTVAVGWGEAVTALPHPAKASTIAADRTLNPLPDPTTSTRPPPRLRLSFDLDCTQGSHLASRGDGGR